LTCLVCWCRGLASKHSVSVELIIERKLLGEVKESLMTLAATKHLPHLRAIMIVCLVLSAVFIATLAGTSTIHAAPKTTHTASIPHTGCAATYPFGIQNCLTWSGNQMCLTDVGGFNTYPEMEPCTGNSNQDWVFSTVSGYQGYYRIKAQSANNCLGTYQGTTQEGAGLFEWSCNTNPDQEWYVQQNVTWGIIRNYKSHYCLGIPGGTMTDYVNPVQWACNGSPDQLWH
jgi:hypothetical protein